MAQTHPEDLITARTTSAGDTGVVLQSGECRVAGIIVSNIAAAAVRYAKIYDKATAPTASDTPIMTIPLTAVGTVGSFFDIVIPNAIRFSNGIGVRCVTGGADNNAVAATAGDVAITVCYTQRIP